MICGALQTLNEEAFEDVVCSERPTPSPTSAGPTGELVVEQQQQQPPQLAPIRETIESDHQLHHPSTSSGVISFSAPNGNGFVLHDHHHNHTQGLANVNAKNANHSQRIHNNCNQQPQQSFVLNMNEQRNEEALPTVIVMPSNTTDDTPL